ncbi:MAG TPA: HEPN domain-containing protein [Sunxiuqinia sp.]|nr:HEPN domain-containing protein [Sunxiuqinia sp.]
MSLTEEERKAILTYRIVKAKETLKEAKGIANLNYWNTVANRLYYACYYITGALLIANNYTAHTHSGVIHLLGLHFIKTGIVSKDSGKIYSKLFELRQSGDYDDLFDLSEEDVMPLIELAENYINELDKLIADQL